MIEALALNAVALGAALAWTLCLRVRPLRLFPMVALLLHVVVIQTWVLATGLAGALDVTAWRAVAAALAAALLLLVWRGPRPLVAEFRHVVRRFRRTIGVIGRARLLTGFTVLAAMTLTLLIVGYLTGPWLGDVAAYHLVPPTDWIVTHRIDAHDWIDARSAWPQGHGLLAAWWMLPARSLRLATWAELHWVLLGWATAWAWARQLNAKPRTAWFAVLLSTAAPIAWAQGTSGLNDLAVATLLLTALAPMLLPRVRPGHFALTLLALIVALGIKPTTLPLAPPIVALMLWRFFTARRTGPHPRHPKISASKFGWLAPIFLAAAATGYWYVRNAILWHNPLYPAGLGFAGTHWLFGDPVIERAVGQVSLRQFTSNFADLVWNKMWDRHAITSGQTEYGSGLGPLTAALALPAAVGLFLTRPRTRPAILAVFTMTLLLCASVADDVFIGRFFAFLPLVAAVLIALVTPAMPIGVPRTLWCTLLVSAAGFSLVTGVARSAPPAAWAQWRERGPIPLAPESLSPHAAFLRSADALPPGAPLVLYSSDSTPPAALLHGPELRRAITYSRTLPDAATVAHWRSANLKWVLVFPTPETPGQSESLENKMRSAGLIHRTGTLYEIR